MNPLYQFIYAADGLYLFVGGIMAALALVFLQRKSVSAFGAVEVAAGLYLLEVARHKGTGALSAAYDHVQISVTLVAEIAAVFLLVRGIDKIISAQQPK